MGKGFESEAPGKGVRNNGSNSRQQLPEPLSPKLFPRCLTKEPGHNQLNTFKDIEQLVAPTAASGLKLPIPRDFMTQSSSKEWVMEDSNDFVEEVFRLKNLDDFGWYLNFVLLPLGSFVVRRWCSFRASDAQQCC